MSRGLNVGSVEKEGLLRNCRWHENWMYRSDGNVELDNRKLCAGDFPYVVCQTEN